MLAFEGKFFASLSLCLAACMGATICAGQPARTGAPRADSARTGSASTVAPELILYNGRILTGVGLAEGHPQVVSAMAIGGGKVIAVGTDAEVRRLAKPETYQRDLDSARTGIFVMPGLNDAHTHMGAAGRQKLSVDLTGAQSLQEMMQRVAAYEKTAEPGAWLLGGGWDHTLWKQSSLPTRAELDAVSGGHPAFLYRVDGHIAVANSAALKAAGITAKTSVPRGGAIDVDSRGEPTGIIRDTAMDLVEKVIPPPTAAFSMRGDELAIDDAVSHGLTSVQDFSSWQDFLNYEQLESEGKLRVRISEWLPFVDPLPVLLEHRSHHDVNDLMLHTGMLKGFMDGSLGSRTAALEAPYSDDPGNSGLARFTQQNLNAMAVERARAGFQIGFHAIGDRATAMALTAFSQPIGGGKLVATGHRDRVEHAQVVNPADVARFKELGVIASMQPNHLLTDMNWAMARLGQQRAATSYGWKRFLDAGVPLAFGTDYPVEPITPFRGIYCAVTRMNEAGTKNWYPADRLTRAQALYAYTQGSAYAEFAEKRKGKLAPGYEADYILLDRDLMTVPAKAILGTRVLETVVNGRTVYAAAYAAASNSR
jgi:hypothetical protein